MTSIHFPKLPGIFGSTNINHRAGGASNQYIDKLPYRIKPAVSWPGGKSRLLKHILPLIPKHDCYAEPFAGGLAVLLAKQR